MLPWVLHSLHRDKHNIKLNININIHIRTYETKPIMNL